MVQHYDIQDRWIDHKEDYDKAEMERAQQLLKEKEMEEKEIDVDNEDEWDKALKDWESKQGTDYYR